MPLTIWDWATRWNISADAIRDLQRQWTGAGHYPSGGVVAINEATVQSQVRLEAARKGILLWRNNVGALKDETGRFVRYGLANDSAAVNERVKSADLIGIRPVYITPQLIGHTIGQFISRECKPPSWNFTGNDRETAQMRWLEIVAGAGGDAAFCKGEGSL